MLDVRINTAFFTKTFLDGAGVGLQLANWFYLLLSGEAVQLRLHTFRALWWNFFLR